MELLTSRRLLKCLGVPLIVAQVGCAANKVQTLSPLPILAVSREDRETCAAFARRQAERTGSVDAPSMGTAASASMIGLQITSVAFSFAGLGAGLIAAVIDAGLAEHHNDLARKYAYDAAEAECLKPVELAATLGPDHPDIAAALRDLAIDCAYHEDYRAAQSLYPRALAIQERAFGPDSDDVATTLEWYARLLRAMSRDEEATFIEARAQGIRASAEQSRQDPEGELHAAASARGVNPPTAHAPTPGAAGQHD